MPPTPIPLGFGIATIKVSLYGTQPPLVTTFGYTNGPSATAATNAANISTHWLANFTLAKTCHHYHYMGVHILQHISAGLEAGDDVHNDVGTLNANEVSPAVAACMTKQTSLAGRKYRGRSYLPAAYLSEANVDEGGVIDSATLTSLQTAANGFLADMNTGSLSLYLLHRDSSAPTVLQDLLVRASVRTVRKRQVLQ